jgi:ABC-type nitrate/sulfonate/bicarbonate transport system permease component
MASAVLRVAARWYSVPLVLAVWEALARTGVISKRLMPSLVEIAAAIWAEFATCKLRYLGGRSIEFVDCNPSLLFHAGISLERAAMGYALAIVFGILLGVAMARSRTFDALFEPLFSFGYPVPKIALYPIFIFVFGFGSLSKVMLIFLECLYPITVNAFYGMRSVDRVHVWAAVNMGASPRQVFWRVLLPGAAPSIFAGLRVALPISLIVVIITEMIGESRGLGYYISYASASFEYATAFAGVAAVAVIGFTLDRVLVWLRNRVIFWERGAAFIGAA